MRLYLLRVFPWSWMLFGGFVSLLFWLALLALVVALVVGLVRSGSRHQSTASSSALDILKERYARGEIGKEDYDNMRQTLLAG